MSTSHGGVGHVDVITMFYTMKKTLALGVPVLLFYGDLILWDQMTRLSAWMGFLHSPSFLLLQSLTFGNTLQ